ncbi:uncharacterized protein LOC128989088 [Macrosteles quadrilineatus]|uniref:uncharacterized protein LOC128989088 n=1 Tax=Macrosteles quadrilineatus TaxID=74068 RepID=UPI0023E1B496|nr:uncharacterized protein LOC128989088 [Macrosteles quadrilineatus]
MFMKFKATCGYGGTCHITLVVGGGDPSWKVDGGRQHNGPQRSRAVGSPRREKLHDFCPTHVSGGHSLWVAGLLPNPNRPSSGAKPALIIFQGFLTLEEEAKVGVEEAAGSLLLPGAQKGVDGMPTFNLKRLCPHHILCLCVVVCNRCAIFSCVRAQVVSPLDLVSPLAMANVTKDPLYNAVRKDDGKRQTVRAQELVCRARVEMPEGGAGIPELEKFQGFLRDYKIVVSFEDPNHKCYMKPDTRKPKSKDFLFIFFDLETRQDESLPSNTDAKVHKVNLCVSQQFCYQCIEAKFCMACKNRTRVFKSEPVTQFMDYVMQVRKNFKDVCVIAHNGQGFDFQFLLKYVLEDTKFTPKLVMRGTKVILMEIDNVRFVDSLSYFPMSLAALPKAFDLPPEKKKGYFPHLFNTLENQNYVGPMPAKKFYCPESMFEKSHKDFENWYNDQVSNNVTFDFKKEILEYCVSDVDILAQACLKFRSIFLQECNVDPFLEAVTIASACNLAFRRNFLKKNTIGIVPKNGYRLTDAQSAIALQWLSWEEEKRGIRIEHAGRGKEVKINGMKVDGYDGKNIYEFQGCYWHGCPKCFPYDRELALKEDPSDSLHLRYERTKSKIAKLGDNVVQMWECEFRKLKKIENMKHLDKLPILNNLPLNPRQAFFGGRTGNAKTYHKCAEGETIEYVDVCSLYPWVCKYGKYPVGHPTIYVGDRECRQRGLNVEGLLKCKVLPPRDLYHPVLPAKMNDKLMFVLCATCGDGQIQSDCDHESGDRALIGTWTMDEIRKAVEKGYVVLDMYELWEYKVATYENGGLFTDFINKFLKMKQEASGFPGWCETEEDKNKYIEDYFQKEGVQLEKDKIVKNGGLRSLAKLMLNSFWGKFGQRENQTKATIVRDPKTLFKMLTSPEIDVNRVQIVNDEVLVVSWEYIDEVGEPLQNVNVVVAAYTTAQARLKLYEHLDALGGQVLYYDTDSVFTSIQLDQIEKMFLSTILDPIFEKVVRKILGNGDGN